MAKVYSWEVSNSPKKYAYIVHPDDYNRVYVGTELKGIKLEKVKDWAAVCTDTQYEEQFNKMVALCKEKGYNVEFETVMAYMNVESTCDNLRGPAGRGIDHIALKDIDDFRNVSIYEIVYDDGETDTFEISNGKDGQNGRDGRDGAQGDAGVSSKLIMIYTSGVDSFGNTFTPARPTGGSYDFGTYEFTRPDEGVWNLNDSDLTPPIWMSSRTFSSNPASTDKEWSYPVKLTGESGKPGADGVSTEFIYYRDKNEPNVENLDSPNEAGYVPPKETGWTASPQGVDEDNLTEWASTRKIDRTTNVWGKWSKAFRWSQYGVNGQDGDGVHYIYLKNAGQIVENPTPANYKTNESYQNRDNEWVPTADVTYTNINGIQVKYSALEERTDDLPPAGIWTDNPSDLTANFHSQWVCSRKYRKGSDGKMVWDKFSDPALWARYGQDGKNATSIRKLYALSSDTKTYPPIPEDTTATSEWGSGFPKDYEAGENVVWAIEAEIWAHNFEFVKTYKIASSVDEDGNVVPPADATMSNTIDVQSIPNEEVEGYDYIRLNGDYYAWSGGWGTPYIVTGVKGESGDPINYTTYAYAFGYTNYPPEAPTGTSPKNPGESTDGLGSRILWYDFPKSNVGTDGYIDPSNNQEMRWYQCLGYVNGRKGEVETWSDVQPCNGHDGTVGPQGNRTEVRFGVTEDSIKPILVQKDEAFNEIKREPELYDSKGNKMGWFATDEELPEVPSGGAVWQIWALIDGATDTVIEQNGKGWNGPVRVSGERGEQGIQGIQGPAGVRGASGIPGATPIQMYCLGTYGKDEKSESYWETGGIDGGDGYFGSVNWKNKALIDDMDGWFIAKDMPYSNILKAYDEEELNAVSQLEENIGRVINLIETSDTGTTNTYYLISKDDDHLSQLTHALDSSEEFNVYVWCIQGNEIWEAGPSSKYVNITKFDNEGNVIPPEDATSDNTAIRNDVPAEEDTLYKYILCNNNYYEWKEIDGDEITYVLTGIEWGSPFRLQGTNGLRGLNGARGQVVYPMGVYNSEEVYITTEDKAPYVYDPNDGMYYVYNNTEHPWVGSLPDEEGEGYKTILVHPTDVKNSKIEVVYEDPLTLPENPNVKYLYYVDKYYTWNGSKYVMASRYKYSIDGSGAEGTWMSDQDGDAPANNYANATNANERPQWVRFESFQALYTSIGIIENGLVGSAVFNNEFMFSQQGVDKNGQPTNYAVASGKDTTYGFLSGYEYDEKGKVNVTGEVLHWYYAGTDNYISKFDVNPYEKDANGIYIHTFMPNVCINFATGQMWLSTGKFRFGLTDNDINVKTSEEIKSDIAQVQSEFKAADDEIMGSVKTLSGDINNQFREIKNTFVANDDLAGLFSELVTENGLVTQAEISTSIEDGIANATISADKVNIGGNVNINNVMTVDNDVVTISNANIEDCEITNVTINGSLRSPFVLDNDTEEVDNVYHDNFSFYTNTEEEITTTYGNNLKWDVDQSGRKVTMVNHKWDNKLSTGRVSITAPSSFNLPYIGRWERDSTVIKGSPGISELGITYFEAYTLESYYPTRSFYGSLDLFQFQIPTGLEEYSIYIKNEKILYDTVNDFTDNNYVIVSNVNKEIPYTYDDGVTPVTGTNVKEVLQLTNGYVKITFENLLSTRPKTVSIAVKQLATETNKYIATLLLPKDSPDKMSFYENGQAKQSITLSRELVNLIGYGDSENFYGWIVENRADIETKYLYGKSLKTLAFGCIRYIKTKNVTTLDKETSYVCTFDGTPVSIGRYEKGKYQIGFDSSWNGTLPFCTVLTSGYGLVTDIGTTVATSKATHMPFTSGKISGIDNGIEVWVSDDASLNDGGFYFLMINYRDLPILRYA